MNTRYRWLCAGGLALGLSLAGVAQADTLLIDRTRQAATVELPRRGMLMDQVLAQFGEPQSRVAPVGGDRPQHPPITRWVYPEFTVYFEHSHVVNAVLNRAGALETGPKPAN